MKFLNLCEIELTYLISMAMLQSIRLVKTQDRTLENTNMNFEKAAQPRDKTHNNGINLRHTETNKLVFGNIFIVL